MKYYTPLNTLRLPTGYTVSEGDSEQVGFWLALRETGLGNTLSMWLPNVDAATVLQGAKSLKQTAARAEKRKALVKYGD